MTAPVIWVGTWPQSPWAGVAESIGKGVGTGLSLAVQQALLKELYPELEEQKKYDALTRKLALWSTLGGPPPADLVQTAKELGIPEEVFYQPKTLPLLPPFTPAPRLSPELLPAPKLTPELPVPNLESHLEELTRPLQTTEPVRLPTLPEKIQAEMSKADWQTLLPLLRIMQAESHWGQQFDLQKQQFDLERMKFILQLLADIDKSQKEAEKKATEAQDLLNKEMIQTFSSVWNDYQSSLSRVLGLLDKITTDPRGAASSTSNTIIGQYNYIRDYLDKIGALKKFDQTIGDRAIDAFIHALQHPLTRRVPQATEELTKGIMDFLNQNPQISERAARRLESALNEAGYEVYADPKSGIVIKKRETESGGIFNWLRSILGIGGKP